MCPDARLTNTDTPPPNKEILDKTKRNSSFSVNKHLRILFPVVIVLKIMMLSLVSQTDTWTKSHHWQSVLSGHDLSRLQYFTQPLSKIAASLPKVFS